MSFAEQQVRPGKYLKIESDKPMEIRILNDSPIEKITHGFGEAESECAGEHCQKCAEGSDATQRFLTNVYSHDFKRVMIWKYPPTVHKLLVNIEAECAAAGKSLKDIDLRVSSSGSNKTKKYMVTMKIASRSVPEGLALFPLDLPF